MTAEACLLCPSPRTIGVLCAQHAVAIATPGVTSEQIWSTTREPGAALVDAWGCAHGVRDGTRVGRDRESSDIAVLHASVSSEHARFRRARGRWHIVDCESKNGTEVDAARVADKELAGGEVIGVGAVTFYFWGEALAKGEPPRGLGRTARSRKVAPYRVDLTTPGGAALTLLERASDGLLRRGDASVELAKMELALLRVLVERLRRVGDPEVAFVPWHEIADALCFQSVDTDADNVRELVYRVRRKIAGLGVRIEAKRGIGYRVTAA